jgi:hypothetical protein
MNCRAKSSVAILVGLILILAVNACDSKTETETRSITVDSNSYGEYPAAFVSLDENKTSPVPSRGQGKGAVIVGDLWVEPRDPEIAGLTSFGGMKHQGQDSKVAIVQDQSWDDVTSLPDNLKWQKKIPKAKIVKDLVFLVKSSNGRHYKVRIEEIEKGSKDPKASKMVLTYQSLP